VPASPLSRRQLLTTAAAGLALAALPARPPQAAGVHGVRARLKPAPARLPVVAMGYPDTHVWAYNGGLPGPELRVPQGARLTVAVENGLEQGTTVHWHGLRLPNAMDGVGHLTQPPIRPGETFTYAFDAPDAGTYWYHPHLRSYEQLARGLYGALIVEEPEPPQVDRELTLILDDWRLTRQAQLAGGFGAPHDMTHAGRLGNTVTVNGRITDKIEVRAGERLRLRLINAANARIFALEMDGHAPVVIALDGQPVTPHTPEGGRIALGPGMRADVILDCAQDPGSRAVVADRFDPRGGYRLFDLAYGDAAPLRRHPLAAPVALPANPLAEPDLDNAKRHQIVFTGGAMGGMQGAVLDGRWHEPRALFAAGKLWALNDIAAKGPADRPLLTLTRGRSYVLDLENDTAWWHPIHLHGHHFRVLSRNGAPAPHRPWHDTALMAPRERVRVAFVADNPGDWMLHCHVLEHQAGGMMGIVRVA
jgi:FtsP/CotA-like multicopper oxidase with cupredoxin domain